MKNYTELLYELREELGSKLRYSTNKDILNWLQTKGRGTPLTLSEYLTLYTTDMRKIRTKLSKGESVLGIDYTSETVIADISKWYFRYSKPHHTIDVVVSQYQVALTHYGVQTQTLVQSKIRQGVLNYIESYYGQLPMVVIYHYRGLLHKEIKKYTDEIAEVIGIDYNKEATRGPSTDHYISVMVQRLGNHYLQVHDSIYRKSKGPTPIEKHLDAIRY